MKYYSPIFIFLLFFSCKSDVNTKKLDTIEWEEFGEELFEKAKAEDKFIILDLKANWCHWCHVMDDSTYANPDVIAVLSKSFLMSKVDQDSNPELANRYKKYGWPATIIFNSEGKELVKRAGYINPRKFLTILDNVKNGKVDAEKKKKTFSASSPQKLLLNRYVNNLDYKKGGSKSNMKFIDYDNYEYAVLNSSLKLNSWVYQTILGSYNLVDPEFGGIYQYSSHGDWKHQHYEKLLSRQARYIKIYCNDYSLNENELSLESALKIYTYSNDFLKGNNPLFYNAQNADLVDGVHSESYFKLSKKERLKLGVPRVDTNKYTTSNAEMIISLTALWGVTGDKKYLNQAEEIYSFLKTTRQSKKGMFSHSEKTETLYSIDDNVKMLNAMFTLNNATQNSIYLNDAFKMVTMLIDNYVQDDFFVKSYLGNNGLSSQPIISENIEFVRALNLASHFFNESEFHVRSVNLFNSLLDKVLTGDIYNEVILLTIEQEIKTEPLHAVVFYTDEAFKNKSIGAIMAFSNYYLNIEAYNINNVPEDVQNNFGEIVTNNVFFCTSNSCSAPFSNTESVTQYLKELYLFKN